MKWYTKTGGNIEKTAELSSQEIENIFDYMYEKLEERIILRYDIENMLHGNNDDIDDFFTDEEDDE